mmetsp:Transcript_40416/g.80982  ORF Transcript_40416/g.80982 Transcript_40416/m.80982 type:complete len:222 (+) Transcript_40416:214-879(+)
MRRVSDLHRFLPSCAFLTVCLPRLHAAEEAEDWRCQGASVPSPEIWRRQGGGSPPPETDAFGRGRRSGGAKGGGAPPTKLDAFGRGRSLRDGGAGCRSGGANGGGLSFPETDAFWQGRSLREGRTGSSSLPRLCPASAPSTSSCRALRSNPCLISAAPCSCLRWSWLPCPAFALRTSASPSWRSLPLSSASAAWSSSASKLSWSSLYSLSSSSFSSSSSYV